MKERVPGELWTEVQEDIVQEAVTKTITQEKKNARRQMQCKWLSEEALQIAEEWREVKDKGKRERFAQLNAEFQKIARRDKKAFLSNHEKKQRKTIEWED